MKSICYKVHPFVWPAMHYFFLQASCRMINYTAQFTEIHYLKICVKNSEIWKHFWNQKAWPLCLTSYALFFYKPLAGWSTTLRTAQSSIDKVVNQKVYKFITFLKSICYKVHQIGLASYELFFYKAHAGWSTTLGTVAHIDPLVEFWI